MVFISYNLYSNILIFPLPLLFPLCVYVKLNNTIRLYYKYTIKNTIRLTSFFH